MISKYLLIGTDYQMIDGKCVRTIHVGMRTAKGTFHVLRAVVSILPEWPTGQGAPLD